MELETLGEAINEAKRFLHRAEPLYARVKKEIKAGNKSYELNFGPVETGAVRRASMDLTRMLAKLRRVAGHA